MNDLNFSMENFNSLQSIIDELRHKSFNIKWRKDIATIIKEEDIRINSVIIGKVCDLPDRIYVGTNSNKILIFDTEGLFIEILELEDGEEIIKLSICKIANDNNVSKYLIVQTSRDSIIFFAANHKSVYQKLQYQINYATSNITSFLIVEVIDDDSLILIGDSSGDVMVTSYNNLMMNKIKLSIISIGEKLNGEIVSAIIGNTNLLNQQLGFVVGYRNGVILLINSSYNVIHKFDVDKEIENMYFIEKTKSLIVTTDDFNIFHFSILNNEIIYNWNYLLGSSVSAIISDNTIESEIEFFTISEDNGSICCFGEAGKMILIADSSFEGTSGEIYNKKIILGSREGEIAQFDFFDQSRINTLKEKLYDSYKHISNSLGGNDFCEFFNSEFESEDRIDYFKDFLITYLNEVRDISFITKITELFQNKKFNTDIADGLISKIISSSALKNIFLKTFTIDGVVGEIVDFQQLVDTNRNSTNLLKKAEAYLNIDHIKYIELMSEIRLQKLDKIWVNKIFEDDDVVAINYFHNPYVSYELDFIIGTRKGVVLLLNQTTGQIIWSFKLDIGDGQIKNIEVADICNTNSLEIIIGLENAQNSILILSTERDKFNSTNNEIELQWNTGIIPNNEFKLYVTRCRVSGMDFNAIHTVHCFDFDYNGVQDLIISSENGRFEIFCFDSDKRDRIVPRTKTIDYKDDDVLVFEMERDINNNITLYTGSAAGNIEKHIYDGSKFIYSNKSFTERDARITDLLLTNLDNEQVILFSSEDNFIYCLNNNLEYKWSFKTRGDIKSIGISELEGEKIIFAISDDTYLYAIDSNGNKKWDYPFFSPLDKLFVSNNNILVADSDGMAYLLHLENSDSIMAKIDSDLQNVKIDLLSLLDNKSKYVRVYAVRKLLENQPSTETLSKIFPLLNDGNEFEDIVRCETLRLITFYYIDKDITNEISDILLSTLKDIAKDVRLESVKSLFYLIEKHAANKVDLISALISITHDEDIWIKEYLAGTINKLNINDPNIATLKWKTLLSLLKLNRDEEWILNETANSLGAFLGSVVDVDLVVNILEELFENNLERETTTRIYHKIPPGDIFNIFQVFDQLKYGNSATLKEAVEVFVQSDFNVANFENTGFFISKLQASLTILDTINIDEIINNNLINAFSKKWNNNIISVEELSKYLNEYHNENNISDKIIFLNYCTESILNATLSKPKLKLIDQKLFELIFEIHLMQLITKTTRLLLEDVFLDVVLDTREVTVNELNIADINFDIINKGYLSVEDIDLSVKESVQFEIINNIGNVGKLVRSQSKKVYFKLKAKTLGALDIFLTITYKGSLKSVSKQLRIFIIKNSHNDWKIIPNPYTSGIPIENDEVFVGRETLLQDAMTALKKDPIFVMGHRRMGKTSFIKYIQRHFLSGPDYITVFISAEKTVFSSMNDFLFSFCRPIADELFQQNILSANQRKDYITAIRTNGLIDFGVFFDDILFEVRILNKTLILIIDEYPIIHEAVELGKIDLQFISNLRGYMQNNSKEFKMIYSGASSLKYLKSQYSSNIMGVGKSIEVSFLEEKDVKNLIDKPLNNQMVFEDSALQYLMEITYGQPFLVQVCLSYLVDKLNKDRKSSMVFKDDIECGINYFLDQAPHLQDDWNSRVYSKDLLWDQNDERIAKAYKQLIITSVTDNWRKNKNGLKKEELYLNLVKNIGKYHTINISIFEETLNILNGPDDILKYDHGLYLIKVGLFRDWVINKMNLTLENVVLDLKEMLTSN